MHPCISQSSSVLFFKAQHARSLAPSLFACFFVCLFFRQIRETPGYETVPQGTGRRGPWKRSWGFWLTACATTFGITLLNYVFLTFQVPGSVHRIAKDLATCNVKLHQSVKAVAVEGNAGWSAATVTPTSVNKPVLTEPAISSAQQWTVKAHAREVTAPTSSAPLEVTAHRIAGTTVPTWGVQQRSAIRSALRATAKCIVSRVQTCASCPVLVEIASCIVMEASVNATALEVDVSYLEQEKRCRSQQWNRYHHRRSSQKEPHQGWCPWLCPCYSLWWRTSFPCTNTDGLSNDFKRLLLHIQVRGHYTTLLLLT